MKNKEVEEKISKIWNDPDRLRDIIQEGINSALLKHKRAGNPICTWKNGKVVWIKPEDINVNNKE